MRLIYVDGQLVDWESATAHFWSEVAIRGVSAFEGLICPWIDDLHHPVSLSQHARRLDRSCSLIGIGNPMKRVDLLTLLTDASKHFRGRSFYARPTVFVKSGRNGSSSDVGHFMGVFDVDTAYRPDVQLAALAPHPRHGGVIPPDAKTGGSYLDFRVLDERLGRDDCTVNLYTDRDGYLTEADGSGLLLVDEDGVWAPPTSGRALDSISRRILLDVIGREPDVVIHHQHTHRAQAHGALLLTAGTLSGVRLARLAEGRAEIEAGHIEFGRRVQAEYRRTLFEQVTARYHTTLSEQEFNV
ncbi:aminotransferase class IV [Sinomonas sp. P47F7]|uniref:aminotransferase class IV n=1 Tax=Sinomonas sp. P47F7 TaxID=3410987 RepID=UPI003BF5B000